MDLPVGWLEITFFSILGSLPVVGAEAISPE